jgi:hypothetical protein
MNSFELLEDLRSASRDNLHSIVLTIVFEDDSVLAGKLINILDLSNPDDVRIHKEFITCILLLMSTIVDAHIKCKKPEIPSPSFVAECFKVNLESFYKKAKIKTPYEKQTISKKITKPPVILN